MRLPLPWGEKVIFGPALLTLTLFSARCGKAIPLAGSGHCETLWIGPCTIDVCAKWKTLQILFIRHVLIQSFCFRERKRT